jgi:hypothetical protein
MDLETIAKIKDGIEKGLIRMLPFVGDAFADLTPEQKREFILRLVEVIARGAAEGAVRAGQDKNK